MKYSKEQQLTLIKLFKNAKIDYDHGKLYIYLFDENSNTFNINYIYNPDPEVIRLVKLKEKLNKLV